MSHYTNPIIHSPRIVIDGRALLDRAPGGIQLATIALVEALAEHARGDFRVVFATRRGSIPPVPLPSVVIRRSNQMQLLAHAIGTGAFFDDMVEAHCGVRPSVVFAPTLQPIRLRSAPLVLVVHDCSFLRFPGWLRGKDRVWHALVHPRMVIQRATHILCPSQFTADELRYFLPATSSRITVIPWGAPPNQQIRNSKFEIRNSPYVVAMGTRHPRKNPKLLQELEGVLRGLNPTYRLVMLDPSRAVSEEQKWELLSGARALVYPSFYEGFGFPPLEAMAAGVPVIAASGSASAEVVGNAGVLVSPYAPEQWEKALGAVLTNEQLRTMLIERGRARIAQFSWQRCAEAVYEVLNYYAPSAHVNPISHNTNPMIQSHRYDSH